MTTKRTPLRPATRFNITPQVLDVYRRARKNYDDEPSGSQTDALRACSDLCDELDSLLYRKPWKVEIFTTIEHDEPQAWEQELGETYVERWYEAKRILTALEKAAA